MKIAYITAGAGGMICGNCLRDNTLARALQALGHEVALIPTYTPIRTDEQDVSLQKVFYGGINVYLQQKFPIFQRTPWVFDRLLDQPWLLRWVSGFAVKTQPSDLGELTVSVLQGTEGRQGKELAKLIAWLKDWRPDVVHLTNSMLSGLAPALKELRVPVCCSLQGEDYFLSGLPSPHREQAFAALRSMASSVDAFIAPCRDHARAMAEHVGIQHSEIDVILPGLDLEGFGERGARDPAEFVVGYLARIAPEKGLHLLAGAFRRIRARRGDKAPRCRLRAAGWLGAEHRSYLEGIQRSLRGSGLEADFEYWGEIDRERKLEFLRSLDVLSVPVTYAAPKGLYALEALASGVPVVQPHTGIFPEMIEATGGGLHFDAGDVDGLADVIETLIDDRDRAQSFGAQGRIKVHEEFTSRGMAEQTAAVYERMTSMMGQ